MSNEPKAEYHRKGCICVKCEDAALAATPPAEGLPDAAQSSLQPPVTTGIREAADLCEKWKVGGLSLTEAEKLIGLVPSLLSSLGAAPLDPDWMADREMGPVGVDRDLWRSLHDLCRIVRTTTGESIRSTLEAYLAGSLDEVGPTLRIEGADPRARTGRGCWVLFNTEDKATWASDSYRGGEPFAPPSGWRWRHMVEAGALPATQGEAARVFDMSGWPHGKIVEIDPDGRARASMSMEIYEVVRKAKGEGKEEGPVAALPDASRLAGALFDFAGYLTAHPEVISVGASAWASPIADRLTAWAKLRGLPLETADVEGWNKAPSEPEGLPEPPPAKGPSPETPAAPAVSEAAGQGVDLGSPTGDCTSCGHPAYLGATRCHCPNGGPIQRRDEDAEILALCEEYGFGSVMQTASRKWRERDPVGAISLGECYGMLEPGKKRGNGVAQTAAGTNVYYCICETRDGDNAKCPIHCAFPAVPEASGAPSAAGPAVQGEPAGPCYRCGDTGWLASDRLRMPCPEGCKPAAPAVSEAAGQGVDPLAPLLEAAQFQVKQWTELCGPVLEYGQRHSKELGIGWGESIFAHILKWMKERVEGRASPEAAGKGLECWVTYGKDGKVFAVSDINPAEKSGFKWVRMVEPPAAVEGEGVGLTWWTREKPTEGGRHYHLREFGKHGRTIVFISDDGEECVTFYNGRREYLGNIHRESWWAGPIPEPGSTEGAEGGANGL